METLNILYALLIISAIIVPIALYKSSKQVKFRLIETRYTYDQSSYTPQVRIDGVWLNLCGSKIITPMVFTAIGDTYLDAHDAVMVIENFKSAGNFKIDSNRKLNSNQKSIIIEEQLEG